MDAVRAAAVLVHGRAHVEVRRDGVGDAPVRIASHQRNTPGLRGATLQPPHDAVLEPGADRRTPPCATISAEIGDDHVPYAATVF